ncbi:hypothetical protein AB9R17_00610 [Neisseria gonorrhoeae]|nr:hypothetical protein [Neisseria gonorrhoeae]ACF29657.1 Conserved hypothetical protein [Neisseria gonorrhoeae NCCP11945]EEZ52409.1 predicted protein [Neisseria gonorrhoeae PID1]EFE04342.1 conserved hypothetical protein [Neisseria gonorrhoeae DGI2]KMW65349.1 hypothetical protein NGCG_01035 [Neisseria gonorrhoeae DGI18]KMY06268.1 hypothetical protein NGIG_00627 [Neisseria gonorrhoeae PID24-1]
MKNIDMEKSGIVYSMKTVIKGVYSELNLNRYGVGSPCRTICTVCGSPPCPDFC